MGKTEGEAGTTHQSPKAEKRGKRTDSRNQSRKNGRDDTENGGKPQGRHANGKGKTVICRVGSERSPCPRLRYPLMGQEEDFVWKTPGGVTHWDIITRQNIPRQIFSLTLIMRRRSLRLPSPKPFRNSDGNTGAFFRAENYRREFYVPKTEGLNVQVFAFRVTFLMGLGKGSDINKPGYCYWRNLVLFPFFSNRIIALQIIFTTFAT